MTRVLRYGFPSMLLCLGILGCAEKPPEAPVVATTGMIADLARHIAGDRLEVVALMGPDVDPHLYSPTRWDVATLQAAELVIYNGLHLEGRMQQTFESLAFMIQMPDEMLDEPSHLALTESASVAFTGPYGGELLLRASFL